jgi:hypothetical protein
MRGNLSAAHSDWMAMAHTGADLANIADQFKKCCEPFPIARAYFRLPALRDPRSVRHRHRGPIGADVSYLPEHRRGSTERRNLAGVSDPRLGFFLGRRFRFGRELKHGRFLSLRQHCQQDDLAVR